MPSRDSCVSSGGAARANAMPRAALHEGSAAAAAAAAHVHAHIRRYIERGRLRGLSHVAREPSGGAAPAPTPAPLLRAACVQRRVWYVCCCCVRSRRGRARAHNQSHTPRLVPLSLSGCACERDTYVWTIDARRFCGAPCRRRALCARCSLLRAPCPRGAATPAAARNMQDNVQDDMQRPRYDALAMVCIQPRS